MNQKNNLLRLLARGFYLLGAVTLLASLGLSLLATPVGATNAPQDKNALEVFQNSGQGKGHCFTSGSVKKDENGSDGWTLTADTGKIFIEVAVKAGQDCYSPNSAGEIIISNKVCYTVIGIGTNSVSVHQNIKDNDCKDISHIEGLQVDSPNPTTETPLPSPTTETPAPSPSTEVTIQPPTEEPTTTETAIIPPTGENTPTTEPGQPTQPTTPPTLPPPPPSNPSSGQPGLLIPVTGADMTQPMPPLSSFLTFLGLIFLGLGMLTHSAARRVEIHH